MNNNPLQPVRFSNGKPTSWWRKAKVVSFVVAVISAALLGAWSYTRISNLATPTGSVPQGQMAPDAVQIALRAGRPTIIEFGANNCVSCREMKPILHALAQDPRIVVADVNILKERDYIRKYQIRLMPTQVFYNAQGEETGRHMGRISAQEILAQMGMTQTGTMPNPAATKAAL